MFAMVVLVVVSACEESTARAGSTRVSFDSAFVLSESVILVDTPAAPIVNPTSIRHWGPRWAVLDQPSRDVKVFDGDGRLAFVIGRSGGGPAEFTRPVAIARSPGDSLAVLDPGSRRISIYSKTGILERELSIPPGLYNDLVVLEDGRFVLAGIRYDLEASNDSLLPRLHVIGDGHVESVGRMPAPTHFGETSLDAVSVAQVGTQLVAHTIVSNRGVLVDLKDHYEDAVVAGPSAYRPVAWPTEDERTTNLAEVSEWWGSQMPVIGLVPIDGARYLIQFSDLASPQPTRYYVVMTTDGETTLIAFASSSTGVPNIRDYVDGSLIAVDQREDGQVEVRRYTIVQGVLQPGN